MGGAGLLREPLLYRERSPPAPWPGLHGTLANEQGYTLRALCASRARHVQRLDGETYAEWEGMSDAHELLTANEAAKLLRVHPSTVRRWVGLGQIPAVRLPSGQIRVPRQAVERLLRQAREG